MSRQVRYRGVREPREAGPGQVWVEETETGMPGEGVTVRGLDPRFDLRRHSPDGFSWSYSGSGPAQLALALLADALDDDEIADALHQEFKREFVCHWHDRWQVDRLTLRLWAAGRWAQRQREEAAAAAALDAAGTDGSWRDSPEEEASRYAES